jgi:hypothetical protein
MANAPGHPAAACSTLDVCEGGLGLLCAGALVVGASYRFDIPDLAKAPLPGIVRWCTPRGSGDYHVGVELAELTQAQSDDICSAIDSWKEEDRSRGDA